MRLSLMFVLSLMSKMLRTVLQILLFFMACKIFLFWFYRSVGFEGNIKYAKKELRQPLNALKRQFSFSLQFVQVKNDHRSKFSNLSNLC